MLTPDLIFLHGQHTARCDALVDKHFTGYRTLQYMTRGAVDLAYGEDRHRLEGLWFWPAWDGPRIQFRAAQGHTWWEHRYIAFQGPASDQWADSGLFPHAPQPAPRGLEHVTAFDQMLALAHQPGKWNQLRAINLLEALLLELAQARSQGEGDATLLQQVDRQLTRSHYEIDYASLAQAMGMGLSTLRRRFAMAAGMSLHAYVLDAKMTAARRWLGQTDLPIKTIATKLGYRDVFFFSRQFKEKVGVPPGAYRTSSQG